MAGSRRLVAAATLLLVGAVAACDALLGLGQYKYVACAFDCQDASLPETSLPEVADADAGDSADAGDALDAGDSADAFDATLLADASEELVPPEASSPHQTWAHWPMPNPDASIAPDSSTPLPNPMSYDAGADGSVLDTVTGLTWEVGSAPASGSTSAWTYCQTLGMRLPTRIELVSLVDFTVTPPMPTINGTAFPGTQAVPYWTSSVVWADAGPDAATQYWSVSFYDGRVTSTPASYVRCVTGGSP